MPAMLFLAQLKPSRKMLQKVYLKISSHAEDYVEYNLLGSRMLN